jgi:hypothetical protein
VGDGDTCGSTSVVDGEVRDIFSSLLFHPLYKKIELLFYLIANGINQLNTQKFKLLLILIFN